MERYVNGRSTFADREVALVDVEDQAYLHQHKGALAMYALREAMGEERVNTALRRLLERSGNAGPPYTTSRDLVRELRAVAPDSLQSLVGDLFEQITLWDVRTERARVEPTGTGAYRVTLDVHAAKMRSDGTGTETEVPMDELVEVGVFGESTDSAEPGEPLYLRKHRLRSGRQMITVTVPRKPARAGVDPQRTLLQRTPADNLVDVEEAAGTGAAGVRR